MMKLMARQAWISALVLLLIVGCDSGKDSSEGGPSKAMDKVSVRFPIPIVEAGQAPFYVANDRGLYAAENLDVTFQMGSRELNPAKMVASGQDTFGVLGGPDTLLVARAAGQPIKAIAVLHRNSNFPCLLTLASSGITTVEQLKGKKVGLFYGHISTDVLRSFFRKANVSVQEVDIGFDYSQLISGKIDAAWAFTVTGGLDLPARGIAVNVISPTSHGIATDGYTVFATDETIRTRSDVVARFLRATVRGVELTLADPETANLTLVSRDLSIDVDLSLKRLRAYNAVTTHLPDAPVGSMTREMFERAYSRLKEEGVLAKDFDVADAYSDRPLATAASATIPR